MTVATFTQPNFTSGVNAADYKAQLDAAISVLARIGVWFAPHAQSSPNMTVRLDAGFLFNAGTLTEVAAQNTGAITAPTVNPRIDRVVVDAATGAVSVVTGIEAGSPVAPAIPAGKLPICRVALATSTTSITNSLITDERSFSANEPAAFAPWTAYTPTVTAGAGSITSYVADFRYTRVGKTVTVSGRLNITNIGTATGAILLTLPVAMRSGSYGMGVYRDVSTGPMGAVTLDYTTSKMSLTRYDNSDPGATARLYDITVTYEAA